jgi:hypothetical protein
MKECNNCNDVKGMVLVKPEAFDLLTQGTAKEVAEYLQKDLSDIAHPDDNSIPDFEYKSDDDEELLYAVAFMTALSLLFDKYKGQSADFVLKSIDGDIINLRNDLTRQIPRLEEIFNREAEAKLLSAGILYENLGKVKLESNIYNGIREQKETIKGITNELRDSLKSKAYFLKNRNSEALFDVNSNFRRAATRTKSMVESGFVNTKQKASRQADVFLYGDPLAQWVTAGDRRVCPFCRALEDAGPMPLSALPACPAHNRCRCDIVLERNLKMTDAALLLTSLVAAEILSEEI